MAPPKIAEQDDYPVDRPEFDGIPTQMVKQSTQAKFSIMVGALMGVSLLAMLEGLVPPILFLALFVIFAVAAVMALLGPTFEKAKPQPRERVLIGSTWRDKTAPEELVRVEGLRSRGVVIIARFAGVAPLTHGKRFAVLEDELLNRFFEVEPGAPGAKLPAAIVPGQVWVDRDNGAKRVKIIHINDYGGIAIERIAGSSRELFKPFVVSPEVFRSRFEEVY